MPPFLPSLLYSASFKAFSELKIETNESSGYNSLITHASFLRVTKSKSMYLNNTLAGQTSMRFSGKADNHYLIHILCYLTGA